MALHWGPGPVFAYECRAAARRWQLFALRTLAASLPGLVLILVWWAKLNGRPLTIRNLASTGETFFYALVGTQLALILVAAPAYAAGAICLDKERGTLLFMLATDLSGAEIILGKLLVRLLAVLGLVLAVVPVLFGAILLGGIEPAAALGALLVSLGVAVLTCTLALTLSVWLRKTYEVLLLVYLLIALFLLLQPMWWIVHSVVGIPPPPAGLEEWNPFVLSFFPYSRPGTPCLGDQALFLVAALAVSALLSLISMLRVRAVALSQANQSQRRRRRWFLWPSPWLLLPGPSLDGNPVLWREWHRKRPSRWALLAWLLYGGIALLFSLWAIAEGLKGGFFSNLPAVLVNVLQVPVGLLLLSVASVTSLAEERVRGSLDVLRATPLSTWTLLSGKWWGAYRATVFVALPPGLVAFALAFASGNLIAVPLIVGSILAYGAVLTSWGLALATWMSRPRQAHVLSAGLVVLMIVGPLFMEFLLFPSSPQAICALASPLFALGALTGHVERPDPILLGGCFVWMLAYWVAAVVIFVVNLATFDHCLGGKRRD